VVIATKRVGALGDRDVRAARDRSAADEHALRADAETVPHRFLAALADDPGASNDELAITLDIGKTAVSRAGRRLHAAGLARKRLVGRRNAW
jgi:DNA-binding MarR family transcriptional regulator